MMCWLCRLINKIKRMNNDCEMKDVKSEIKCMKELDHKNIVKLYGIIYDDYNIWYVLEIIEGTNLQI